MSPFGVGSSMCRPQKVRRLRPLHVCLPIWGYSCRRKISIGAIAAVTLMLIIAAVAIYYAVSVSPFYQQQVNLINFTATGMTYTYVPKGAEVLTGEAAAGAGSGFG